jgi:hypothetical protein
MFFSFYSLKSITKVEQAGPRLVNYTDFSLSNHWYRFEIEETGIYCLTYSDLSLLHLSDIDPATFRIFTNGGALININPDETGYPLEEIPLYVLGDSDGCFDLTDLVIFYAENRDSGSKNSIVSQSFNPYSGECVYWFTFEGEFPDHPRRMTNIPIPTGSPTSYTSYPVTLSFEEENIRKSIDNFKWFSAKIYPNESYSNVCNILDTSGSIPDIARLELSLEQAGDFQGTVNTINVLNNGVISFTQNWTAIQGYYINKSDFPITNGLNNIEIRVLSSNPVLLDYMRLRYNRRLKKYTDTSLFIDIQLSDAGQNCLFRIETDMEQDLIVIQADNYADAYLVPFVQDNEELTFNTDCKQVNASYTIEPDYYIVNQENLLQVNNFTQYYPNDTSDINTESDCIIITPSEYLSQVSVLVELYHNYKGITTEVVKLEDIFDQFNGGNPDPGAIRLFLKYSLRQLSHPESLQVVLVGSSTNDWRGFDEKSVPLNRMIVYQRGAATSDDYFTMFTQTEYPELRIARIPVRNGEELELYLTRIEENYNQFVSGWWRNSVLLMADDEQNNSTNDEYYFTENIEEAVHVVGSDRIVNRLYATDYERDTFNNKPEVRDLLIDYLNKGVNLWYYMGHGHADKLGEENFFNLASDVKRLDNNNKLPIFIAASCNVGQFDSNDFDCLGRSLLFRPEGGISASMTASRVCLGAESHIFALKTISELVDNRVTPMEAFFRAKTSSEYTYNSIKFNYFGDPYLNWEFPDVISDLKIPITNKSTPAYWRRQLVELTGSINDSISVNSVDIIAIDNDTSNLLPDNSMYSYPGNVFYRGEAPVVGSDFDISFRISEDAVPGDNARVLAYFYDNDIAKDYLATLNPMKIYNQTLYSTDTTPPEITLLLDSEEFQSGDTVSANPSLEIRISDESGINIIDANGHATLLSIDGGASVLNISGELKYEESSTTTVSYSTNLSALIPGKHSLELIAFDNINNMGIKKVYFMVNSSENLLLNDVLPYPNPMSKRGGYFTAVVNKPVQASLKIYTLSGRKIRTLKSNGSHYLQIKWDGLDSNGDEIAKGNYFYNLTAKTLDGSESAKKLGKLIVTD